MAAAAKRWIGIYYALDQSAGERGALGVNGKGQRRAYCYWASRVLGRGGVGGQGPREWIWRGWLVEEGAPTIGGSPIYTPLDQSGSPGWRGWQEPTPPRQINKAAGRQEHKQGEMEKSGEY